jgi:Capsule assembly protein Wzi
VRRYLACLIALAFCSLPAAARAVSPGWVDSGDATLRAAVERLVDERVFDLPLMSWPIAAAELRVAIDAARRDGRIGAAQEARVARVEAALGRARREWSVAAGDPSDLRGFEDAPREAGEIGLRQSWRSSERVAAVMRLRVALDPVDGQHLRPDGSYLTARAGNWLMSAGWQDRWWGGGQEGSLQLSSNARPVFAFSLDRETSRPFETRWLSWVGPWTLGTFMGALEGNRPDSNHALLWGIRASARPLPGFEFSVTRNAQFCGDKPPCSLSAFWNVVAGNDNVGESISATDEPGNQLASYEARWGGRIAGRPVAFHFQNTGETIDNKFPRPLRTLSLIDASTWGSFESGAAWQAHLEFSTTTCADFDDAQSSNCAYENGVFTAGYRYRGRVLGHSTDSDSRQWAIGLLLDHGNRSWTARLRRAEINRIGTVPQSNHLLSVGPQVWWVAEGLLKQPLGGGNVELALGLEHRKDSLTDDTDLVPKGYLRWTQAF